MLRLDEKPAEPFWESYSEKPKLRFRFKPVEPFMSVAAKMAAADAIAGLDRKTTPTRIIIAKLEEAFVTELAVMGICDWEGVGDHKGDPIPPDETRIRAVMKKGPIFEFVRDRYAKKEVLDFFEKNASSPSPRGTGGARTKAKTSAATARKGRARRARMSATGPSAATASPPGTS